MYQSCLGKTPKATNNGGRAQKKDSIKIDDKTSDDSRFQVLTSKTVADLRSKGSLSKFQFES